MTLVNYQYYSNKLSFNLKDFVLQLIKVALVITVAMIKNDFDYKGIIKIITVKQNVNTNKQVFFSAFILCEHRRNKET